MGKSLSGAGSPRSPWKRVIKWLLLLEYQKDEEDAIEHATGVCGLQEYK